MPPSCRPAPTAPGRLLTGHLSLGQLKRGGGAAPHKLDVSYLVPPAANAATAGGANGGAGAAKDEPGEGVEALNAHAIGSGRGASCHTP